MYFLLLKETEFYNTLMSYETTKVEIFNVFQPLENKQFVLVKINSNYSENVQMQDIKNTFLC
jgi:hypothetical protein